MTHRSTLIAIVGLALVGLAGCSSGSSPAASPATTHTAPSSSAASPAAPSPSCTLPDSEDLIVRDDDPGASIIASELGEANLGNCTTTLSTFEQTAGQAAGECTTIAWAKDNPGYDVNAVPAAPLKHVIESAGPGC